MGATSRVFAALLRRPRSGRIMGQGETGMVRTKRVYELPEADDGQRVLVDRLWPRGLSRNAAQVGLWLQEIAPSDELRRWFGHDPARWEEFRQRYLQELRVSPGREALEHLVALSRQGPLTLVYAARDPEHNNALVLKDVLDAGGQKVAPV